MAWLIGRFAAFEKTYPNLSVYLNAAPKALAIMLSVYDIEVVLQLTAKIDEKFHLSMNFFYQCALLPMLKNTMELQNLSDQDYY